MDILNLISDVVGHPGVILVVLGLVEYFRQLGLRDKPLLVSSLLTGVVFGGGAIIAENGVPQDFAGWFYVVLAGLVFGLIASGIVDLTGRLISKNVAEATENPEAAIAAAE
jgi:hypothetical protein